MFDLRVHDNLVRNTVCDGIAMTTTNADLGPVEVYNNVLYHVGTGPDPQGQLSHYTGIQVDSSVGPTAKALVYNNSIYDAGSRGSVAGGFDAGVPVQYNNNVFQSTGSSEPYFLSACTNVSGSNNAWFGNGAAPCSSNLTGNLNVNPLFNGVNAATGLIDLRLQLTSPLVDAGTTRAGLRTDITGISRPQGSAYDIGAYESFSGGSTVQLPNPPTNLVVTVQ
jgi:hypothetical protein